MLGILVVLIWLGLILVWGGFWRADQRLVDVAGPKIWPEVVAIIPARDEAQTIGAVLAAHGRSVYPGRFRIIVVDDGSSDGTAEIAGAQSGAHPVTVIPAPDLPQGWSGKLNAVAEGLRYAANTAPEARYVLLTDADIEHAPQTLTRLVAIAEARGLAMVSLMARLDARGIWGGLLIPAFVFFFQKLYPFAWVNRPGHWMSAAAGGCMLIRRDVLEARGGIAMIKDALIDDCALGRLLKQGPPAAPVWLGLADREIVSLRDNRSLGSIWTMVARTAFTQLRHSWVLLVGAVLGMALVYLAPPVLFIAGAVSANLDWFTAGAAALGLMAFAYAPTLQLYGQPAWRGICLPIAALLYTAMTISSAIRHWRGSGGQWKGRTYP